MSRQVIFDRWGRSCPTFPYRHARIDYNPNWNPKVYPEVGKPVVLGVSDPLDSGPEWKSFFRKSNQFGAYIYDLAGSDADDYFRSSVIATEADPILRSVFATERFFQSGGRPTRRTILLQLPAEHGGPRECDGAQIRVLVDWLVEKHGGWAPPEGLRPAVAVSLDPATKARIHRANREEADLLNQKLSAARADIRRLAVVADWLDKAPR